jgi:hypothetical protein
MLLTLFCDGDDDDTSSLNGTSRCEWPAPSEALRLPRYRGQVCISKGLLSISMVGSIPHAIVNAYVMSVGSPPPQGILATASTADINASAKAPPSVAEVCRTNLCLGKHVPAAAATLCTSLTAVVWHEGAGISIAQPACVLWCL